MRKPFRYNGEEITQNVDIIKTVWPLILIELAVVIYAIIDVARHKKTKNLSPSIWIIIILLTNLVGSILYFLIGRSED